MATMLLDLLVARRCENKTPLVRSIDYNDSKHCVFVGSKLKKLELSNTLLFYPQLDLGVTSLFKNQHFFIGFPVSCLWISWIGIPVHPPF